FGHGPSDLHQEMVLRVLSQRLIEALDATASLCELFQEDHVMDIVAGQPIWTGHDDPVKDGLFEPIPPAIPARPIPGGAPTALTTENILRAPRLALAIDVRSEARNRLVNRLCQRLPLGRYAGIDGCSHTCPPSVVGGRVQGRNRRGACGAQSNPEDIGRPGPTVVLRPPSAGIGVVSASGVS